MASKLSSLVIALGLDSTEYDKELAKAVKTLKKAGDDLETVGKRMAIAITAPLVAIGAAAFKSGEELEVAFVKIQNSTGATGEKLKGLENSFRSVYAQSEASSGSIATAMSTITQRTKLTGVALESLTTAMLTMARVAGVDVTAIAPQLTATFTAWGISTDKQSSAMKYLTSISQQTAVSLPQLLERINQFHAPLARMGFSFEDSAAMMASFEAAGMPVERTMAGLTRGLVTFSKEGAADAHAAFVMLIEKMKGAANQTAATALAVHEFGSRAGIQLADAVQAGRFDDILDGKLKRVAIAAQGAAAAPLTLEQNWKKLEHQLALVLEPLWRNLEEGAIRGIEALKPLISTLGDLSKSFASLQPSTQGWIVGIGGLAAVIPIVVIALGSLIHNIGVVAAAMPKAFAVFSTPTLLIVAAIVIAIAGVGTASVVAHGQLKELYMLLENYGVFVNFAAGLAEVKKSLSSGWKEITETFKTGWSEVSGYLKTGWGEIANTFAAGLGTISGAFKGSDAFAGFFVVLDNLKSGLDTLAAGWTECMKVLAETAPVKAAEKLWAWFTDVLDTFKVGLDELTKMLGNSEFAVAKVDAVWKKTIASMKPPDLSSVATGLRVVGTATAGLGDEHKRLTEALKQAEEQFIRLAMAYRDGKASADQVRDAHARVLEISKELKPTMENLGLSAGKSARQFDIMSLGLQDAAMYTVLLENRHKILTAQFEGAKDQARLAAEGFDVYADAAKNADLATATLTGGTFGFDKLWATIAAAQAGMTGWIGTTLPDGISRATAAIAGSLAQFDQWVAAIKALPAPSIPIGIAAIPGVAFDAKYTAEMKAYADEFTRIDDLYRLAPEYIDEYKAALDDLAKRFPMAAKAAEDAGGKMATAGVKAGRGMSDGLRLVNQAINDIGRGLADVIVNGAKMGEVFMKLAKDIAAAIIEEVVKKAFGALFKAIADSNSQLSAMGKVLAKLFGPVGSAGSSGGSGGSGGGGGGGASGSGVMGIVNMITGIGTLVSGIIGNFQNMAMNKSLDIIVSHTLQAAMTLRSIEAFLRAILNGIHDRLVEFRSYGIGIYPQEGYAGINVTGGSGAGGIGSLTLQIIGGYFLSQRAQEDFFQSFMDFLRARGVQIG